MVKNNTGIRSEVNVYAWFAKLMMCAVFYCHKTLVLPSGSLYSLEISHNYIHYMLCFLLFNCKVKILLSVSL